MAGVCYEAFGQNFAVFSMLSVNVCVIHPRGIYFFRVFSDMYFLNILQRLRYVYVYTV